MDCFFAKRKMAVLRLKTFSLSYYFCGIIKKTQPCSKQLSCIIAIDEQNDNILLTSKLQYKNFLNVEPIWAILSR